MRAAARRRAALALVPALVGGCFSQRVDATAPVVANGDCSIPVGSPVIGAATTLVAIKGFAFQPDHVVIAPGTTVTWINCEADGVDAHTSTADAEGWSSAFLPPGATFSHTFPAAGRFDYHCVPHPFMRGTVEVQQ